MKKLLGFILRPGAGEAISIATYVMYGTDRGLRMIGGTARDPRCECSACDYLECLRS